MDELMDELHDAAKTAFCMHHSHYEFAVMPFGLTNTPTTFQASMNALFAEQLRRYVVVFFDDILIYSGYLNDHFRHLMMVFSLLKEYTFYVRREKCSFGLTELAYLGHIIAWDGVRPDPEKVSTVANWPIPSSTRQIRAFLGLTSYYQKFISRYAEVVAPITDLLRKQSSGLHDAAGEAFIQLKKLLTSAPMLAYSDFSQPFMVETDTCKVGTGAVLLQQQHPVAFFSWKLSALRQQVSTYARELLAIMEAVRKWRHYLLGMEFTIRIDHRSLRKLLNQTIQTLEQQYFLSKLLGYSYSIIYKQGKENIVIGALSRLPENLEPVQSGQFMVLVCQPMPEWLNQLQQENIADPWLSGLCQKIKEGKTKTEYTINNDFIFYDTRFLPQTYFRLNSNNDDQTT